MMKRVDKISAKTSMRGASWGISIPFLTPVPFPGPVLGIWCNMYVCVRVRAREYEYECECEGKCVYV